MKRIFTWSNLLFFILTGVAFFLSGIFYAVLTGAGKNQGLAGGPIVLSYGVIASAIALILAIYLALSASRQVITKLSLILAIIIIGLCVFFKLKYDERERKANGDVGMNPTKELQIAKGEMKARRIDSDAAVSPGLGLFSTDLTRDLYFYSLDPNSKDHTAYKVTDSITFNVDQYGNPNIEYAPPSLAPEHLKLDYGIMFFKVLGISKDHIEVEMNKITGQTAIVARENGKLYYWSDFYLIVNSVEFIEPSQHFVLHRPFEYSDPLKAEYDFMKPIKVSTDWMEVELYNEDYELLGRGWIQWIKNGRILITYSLLS